MVLVVVLITTITFSSCNKEDEEIDTPISIVENESANGDSSESNESNAIRITKCTLTPTSTSIIVQLSVSKEPLSIKIHYGTGSTFSLSKSINPVSGTRIATTLTALKRDTKYCLKIVMQDKNMNTYESGKYYCTTTK